MTKQEQVNKLDDGTRSDDEIAAIVGCKRSYVRTCRQRYGRPSRNSPRGCDDRSFVEPWAVYSARKKAERAARGSAP